VKFWVFVVVPSETTTGNVYVPATTLLTEGGGVEPAFVLPQPEIADVASSSNSAVAIREIFLRRFMPIGKRTREHRKVPAQTLALTEADCVCSVAMVIVTTPDAPDASDRVAGATEQDALAGSVPQDIETVPVYPPMDATERL
jgi:hypothetical protein